MHCLRERINRTNSLVGAFCSTPSPMIVEMLGGGGFDFVIVDAEHSQIGRDTLENLVRAGDAADMPVLVRVPTGESHWIASALDCGAAGIVVPRVGTADEARAVVQASRYPPIGQRGFGLSRATGYGLRAQEYLRGANENLLVVVQAESAEAVENIDEIAAVPGIDVIFIGPNDLALSLGCPGRQDDPRLTGAIETILAAGKVHGVHIGILQMDIADIPPSAARGFSFFAATGDILFMLNGVGGAARQMAELRGKGDAA